MTAATGATEVGEGTLVILPTYNEAENIEALVGEVRAALPEVTVLVVDDGSPDGTADLAQAIADKDDHVEVLRRGAKLGLGTAYVAGFRHALARDFSRVVTMDADFSHHPRHLPAIVGKSREPGVDLVIGSRYIAGGGVVGWGPHRRILSRGANTFARSLLRLGPHDCTGGYRCYTRRVLEGIDLDALVSHGYSALMELLWMCRNAGFNVREVPITFADRELGQSKISGAEIRRGLTTVVRLRFRRRTSPSRVSA